MGNIIKKRLKIASKSSDQPTDRGRVILEEHSFPMKGGNEPIEYICGTCFNPLLIGLHPDHFHTIFGNSPEILIQCNRCKCYNDATPPPLPPLHLDSNLLPEVKSFLSYAMGSSNRLITQFRHCEPGDPRFDVANHLLSVAETTFLNLIYVKEYLRHDSWWKDHDFGQAVEAGIVPRMLENYFSMTSGSLIFFSFSLFESGIRRVVRSIDPTACSSGSAEFAGICSWLFARLRRVGWSYPKGNPINFLNLFRSFRNTLHNNGHFYPKTGGNYEVVWQGKSYLFVHGQAPDFVNWEFNLMILRELIDLNESIMTSTLVSELEAIP